MNPGEALAEAEQEHNRAEQEQRRAAQERERVELLAQKLRDLGVYPDLIS